MLILANDRVLITSASTIRFKILIVTVLLLVTRARRFEIKRNPDDFYEALDLDAVTSNMIYVLKRLTVHY